MVILSLAIDDKKYGRDSTKRNYALNLDSLFKICGVDDEYESGDESQSAASAAVISASL